VERELLRRRTADLREQGWSSVRIGRELGCSSNTALRILRELGFDTSPTALDAGKISATEAARRYGVNRHSLVRAVEAGRVRGQRVHHGRGPGGIEFRFDPAQLEHDLAALPRCEYDGCTRMVLGTSGGCEHHGHVFQGDRARGVARPDIGPKISAAKKGRARPDAGDRLRSAWAAREGSPFTRGWARWHGGRIAQRWLGRWDGRAFGHLGGRPKAIATEAQSVEIYRLAASGWGRRAIATRLRLSERLVRNALARP
jgi:DNA invertase Pin-like site-specific DNA recombinase